VESWGGVAGKMAMGGKLGKNFEQDGHGRKVGELKSGEQDGHGWNVGEEF